MPAADRKQLARDMFAAYANSDRDVVERMIAEDFVFFSPPDPGIDREEYFERCWPNAGSTEGFEIVRMIEDGDEVVVTYEVTKIDGGRFRNTEVLTFAGDQLSRVEVYFGWDIVE